MVYLKLIDTIPYGTLTLNQGSQSAVYIQINKQKNKIN